jgi:hypothetical protein
MASLERRRFGPGITIYNKDKILDMPGARCQGINYMPRSGGAAGGGGNQVGAAGGGSGGSVTASRRRASDLKVSLRMLAGQ